MTNPYVIIVDFQLARGSRSMFRALIDDNARLSVEREPGCHRFDVLEPVEDTDRILVYEIYENAAAFAIHLESQHFQAFNAASQGLSVAKNVTAYTLVCSASVDLAETATLSGER